MNDYLLIFFNLTSTGDFLVLIVTVIIIILLVVKNVFYCEKYKATKNKAGQGRF
jgi:hypothetical protein